MGKNAYILSFRVPTLVCMVIASISIGVATLIFQSIVNNRIVTPALLGMNSIYSFLHTAAVFAFGTGSSLYKDGKIVHFMQHTNVCYTSTGGVQELDTMLSDLEAALLG